MSSIVITIRNVYIIHISILIITELLEIKQLALYALSVFIVQPNNLICTFCI